MTKCQTGRHLRVDRTRGGQPGYCIIPWCWHRDQRVGSHPDIGARLGISVRTVERHRENIMARLDLHSRTHLVNCALRKGLIQLEAE